MELNDFGKTISGSRWQAALGKELKKVLTQELNAPFKYKRAGRYNLIYLRHGWYIPYQHAAFQVSLDNLELFAGIKIERGLKFSEKPELTYHKGWDYWRFEQGLFNKNPQFLRAIEHALSLGLTFTICDDGDKGCKDNELDNAIERLMDWDAQRWCNVYIGNCVPGKEAIKLGGQVTNFCMDSFLEVSKLYWLCVEG